MPQHSNLIVTRTLSKAHSLAGFRVGYAVLPEAMAHELNVHNDAYPLARVSQAAAIATLQHEAKIAERALLLRSWTNELARELRELGDLRRRRLQTGRRSLRCSLAAAA